MHSRITKGIVSVEDFLQYGHLCNVAEGPNVSPSVLFGYEVGKMFRYVIQVVIYVQPDY